MATIENVEKLRERANVTYEEAREALDACGGDLLDAMIFLESQGKVPPPASGGSYSSGAAHGESRAARERERSEEPKGESFSDMMKRFLRFCGELLQKGNTNMFEVWRHGRYAFSIPVTVLVVALFFFWVTVPLMILGLFFGFRYRFSGKDLEGAAVNRAMDGAADAAESFKEEMRSHKEDKERERDC